MSQSRPSLNRKPSTPWDRLRPVRQDQLEAVGYVSKGDKALLNPRTQETFYHKITARYMQFCTQHGKNLDEAFASLSCTAQKADLPPASHDSAAVVAQLSETIATNSTDGSHQPGSTQGSKNGASAKKSSAEELSTILTALRKLRESLLATSKTAASPLFSQRVHIFNIRLAILVLHHDSYHASLRYLLEELHTREHPLPQSELREMTSYLILDTALRLDDFNEAYRIRMRARSTFGYANQDVDRILHTVVASNWPSFWRTRRSVDGYIRAIMDYQLDSLRKSTLKAIGKSYLKCDIKWIVQSATGNEMNWDELVVKEDIGWLKDKDAAIIRRPKPKG